MGVFSMYLTFTRTHVVRYTAHMGDLTAVLSDAAVCPSDSIMLVGLTFDDFTP